ncbi:MAG: gamma-glutamyl-gamma-aminobutyrate hydrolase family protein [Lachnospiraceae bacterium]|nr:gamma-glutamyl-gamma-aminobutyrate hydrolase family protein [Lachnospiraceae bacterium]
MLKILICGPFEEVTNYIAAVEKTGMEPVALTVLPTQDGLDINDFAGLILPGGSDIDPAFYGQENHDCRNIRRWLDEAQLHMLDAFVKCKKPVLGICKGAQVINVYFGGTLIQDLPDSEHHKATYLNHVRMDAHHPTRILTGTPLSDIYSNDEIITNSAHHQAVDRVAEDLEVCAYSDDGVIEGLHHKSLPILALQWHPERMAYNFYTEDYSDGSLIFQYLKEQLK